MFSKTTIQALVLANVFTAFAAPTAAPAPAPLVARDDDDSDPIKLIYHYPNTGWLEDIAVVESGDLLITLTTAPRLNVLNPFADDPEPSVLYEFQQQNAITGIIEVDTNLFVMSAGNFTTADSSTDNSIRPIPGTWSFWYMDNTSGTPVVTKIADAPELAFPDGMTHVPGTHDVLSCDVGTGKIVRVFPGNSSYHEVIYNNYTAPYQNVAFGDAGVNGVHIQDDTLYFTNSGLSIFASMPIDPETSVQAGEVTTIATGPFNTTKFQFDDFTFSPDGQAAYLVTGGGNSILRMKLDGTSEGQLVAGRLNSTILAEPNSCRFGRTDEDAHILYVITQGGLSVEVNGNTTVPAQIMAINTTLWMENVASGMVSASTGWSFTNASDTM